MKKHYISLLFFASIIYTLSNCDSNNDSKPFEKVKIPFCRQIASRSKDGSYAIFNFDSLNNLINQNNGTTLSVYSYKNNNLSSITNDKQFFVKYNSLNMVEEVLLYDKYGKTGTSYSLTYDNNKRLCKWIYNENSYKNGFIFENSVYTETTIIKYYKDGNVLSLETEKFEKNINSSIKTRYSRRKIEYSQYDSHPNAVRFLVNSFYLPLILSPSNSSNFFSEGYGLSINNPQMGKKYYWSERDNNFRVYDVYTYSIEYSGDLVSKIYQKGETFGNLETISLFYKCN